MKKILFILLSLVLFLSLSFNAFALGEDYLFTSNYWYTVFDNTSTRITYEDETFYRGGLDPYSVNLSIDNVLQDESYIFSPVVQTSPQRTTRGRLYLPVGIELIPNQTLYLSFVFMPFFDSSEVANFNLTFDDSIVMNTEVAHYDTLNISNLPDTWYNTDTVTSTGYIVTGTYTNTSNTNITLTSLTVFYESTNGFGLNVGDYTNRPLFYFGVPVSNTDPVVLPSYVETNLINIGNLLRQQISKMDDIISYIDEIQSILDLLLENNDTSSSVTNNFYDQVINPSPESSSITEELKDLLQEAKDELASMRETIETVTVPELSDINAVQMSPEQISDAFTSQQLTTVLGSIFNTSSVVTMLLAVISIATVGYIMFGKRA